MRLCKTTPCIKKSSLFFNGLTLFTSGTLGTGNGAERGGKGEKHRFVVARNCLELRTIPSRILGVR
jgi:hypothetical protein